MPRVLTLTPVLEQMKSAPSSDEVKPNGRGLRKLVRPGPSSGLQESRNFGKRDELPMLAHQMALEASLAVRESTHAEAFYLQKQMQMQMLMVFVLEDGERIEGYIEWYDSTAIKVRHGGRTLIYKAALKYLYKLHENGQ